MKRSQAFGRKSASSGKPRSPRRALTGSAAVRRSPSGDVGQSQGGRAEGCRSGAAARRFVGRGHAHCPAVDGHRGRNRSRARTPRCGARSDPRATPPNTGVPGRPSPMCKTALALRFNGRKRHAICSRRGGRLVQWTAGCRISRRDSRLIVKTCPQITVNWPALASSILEDSGPVFTNRRRGAISPVRSVPDSPASTAPRAREPCRHFVYGPYLA